MEASIATAAMRYQKELSLVGFNHRTVPVEQRELVTSLERDSGGLLAPLVSSCSLEEAAVISTCNRFEVVSVGDGAASRVLDFLVHKVGGAISPTSFYRFTDRDAVRHLFQVASSLDSMVVGEPQILGQVKDSYARACEGGHTGKYLHHLFQCAFSLAKKVRANTGIAERGVSVSYVAVQLAKQIFGELHSRTALVVGSGKMAELMALHLRSYGCRNIVVANRTIERATELASRIGGSAIGLDEIPVALEGADVVVGSITADRPVLDQPMLLRRKAARPLFLIDLGVPRNFPSSLSSVDDVYLYNIDDLSGLADANKFLREEAAKDAEIVVEFGVFQFERWLTKVSSEPALLKFRQLVRGVCERELTAVLAGKLPPEECESVLHALVHRLGQTLSHEVTELLARHPEGRLKPESLLPLLYDDFLSFEG